ncbi:MAG: glycoside hydrolase family 3 protein [Ruminococcaceae bacterium]|nr:glycoside hydrolase family 3 protein [Oscillospiraceae bacterium]
MLKAVVRGMQDGGIAACAKHFPGDGLDYRDQHRVTTTNSLSVEEWKRLSGRVFREMIEDGVYTIMAGHINFPAYQKELLDGFPPPATLSRELITDLLKGELGFEGVVVTDALGMGGFLGYYEDDCQALIECFRAGCDMMLWPKKGYFEAMKAAVESGYIPMERLDDAVNRILALKEKLGLFQSDNAPVILSDEEKAYVRDVARRVGEKSITLLRDTAGNFPLTPERCPKIAVVAASHWPAAYAEAELLCEELRARGFDVDYYDRPTVFAKNRAVSCAKMDSYDRIIYAIFSRVFRPSGPEDFYGEECAKIKVALSHAVDKTIAVSFGSPYYMDEYFARGKTCVNAYSFVSASVKAFVRAACGETEFTGTSPVNIIRPYFKV